MTTLDTTRWYRTDGGYRKVQPLVSFTDTRGFAAAADCQTGIFTLVPAAALTLDGERFTFEWRLAKKGERYGDNGVIRTIDHDSLTEQWVVVDDEVTS